MSEMVSAADAPLMPATSGSFSVSAERTKAMTWVSHLKPSAKQRADGTVNLATGERFALTHAAFALDEAAGDASASVGVFAIVNGEREEIDALARVGIGSGGGEDNVVADSHHDRAVGLLGQFSSFKRNPFTTGEFNRNFLFHYFSFEGEVYQALSCEL